MTTKSALPERLIVDEQGWIKAEGTRRFPMAGRDLFRPWPGRNESVTIAAALVHRYNCYDELVQAAIEGRCHAFCDCGHPACKRCKATKWFSAVLAKAGESV